MDALVVPIQCFCAFVFSSNDEVLIKKRSNDEVFSGRDPRST